jgi:formyltetrahydrofolate-dependent phosphoribosylglycinamide formyltransferase
MENRPEGPLSLARVPAIANKTRMAESEPRPSSVEEVRKLRDDLHARRQRLVFTNGCFDLLHAGHVRYLAQARALGDALVVALNSDRSVTELKGPTRPVNKQNDRAEILRALRSVDAVVIFDEPRVTKLIEAIKPHVYAKGGDYTVDTLNPEERDALQSVKAEIKILPLVPGRSTTRTLNRLAGKGDASGSTLRLGVLGSGEGSNLAAILHAIKKGDLDAEVVAVISDVEQSGVMKLAKEAHIPGFFIEPGSHHWKLGDEAQKDISECLQNHQVDVVVLTGFMREIRDPVLSAFKDRIVNVHPSLLPKFKGRNAVQDALDDGEIETGCTVHLVTEQVDAGRILAQATVPIDIGDKAKELHERIKEQEHRLLPKVLGEWRQMGLPVREEAKA